MYQETSREVLNFIEHSPSCFHAVEQLSQMLDQAEQKVRLLLGGEAQEEVPFQEGEQNDGL